MTVLVPTAGLGSAALVLSIAAPFGGNWWYLLTLISPAAGAYYLRKGDRQEEVLMTFDAVHTPCMLSAVVPEAARPHTAACAAIPIA